MADNYYCIMEVVSKQSSSPKALIRLISLSQVNMDILVYGAANSSFHAVLGTDSLIKTSSLIKIRKGVQKGATYCVMPALKEIDCGNMGVLLSFLKPVYPISLCLTRVLDSYP